MASILVGPVWGCFSQTAESRGWAGDQNLRRFAQIRRAGATHRWHDRPAFGCRRPQQEMGVGLDRIRAPSDADGGRDRTRAATGEQASQGTPELHRLLHSLPDALCARPGRALLHLSPQHRGRPRSTAPTVAALATGGGGAGGERRLSDSRSRVMIGPTVADVIRSLGNVPLFAGIDRGELERLANLMRE